MSLHAQLVALRARSEELVSTIRGLGPEQWRAETNCPPWRVRDLSAHLASSGQGFVRSIERGLAGSVEPPAPGGGGSALAEADPEAVAAVLAEVTNRFEALYDGLSEAQLETICWHRRGNRSIRWYAAHRLAEVAFHGWDLETSLGRAPRFDDTIAKLLLPTLLESNVPRTYAAGLSAERGSGERYRLAVHDEPDLAWLVTIDPEELRVARGKQASADVRITSTAADLALLVYGRRDIQAMAQVEGDASAIERFAQIFPRP